MRVPTINLTRPDGIACVVNASDRDELLRSGWSDSSNEEEADDEDGPVSAVSSHIRDLFDDRSLQRLAALGVFTVADLRAADRRDLLDIPYINAQRLDAALAKAGR